MVLQHRTVLIIFFSLIIQTIIIAQMLSNRGTRRVIGELSLFENAWSIWTRWTISQRRSTPVIKSTVFFQHRSSNYISRLHQPASALVRPTCVKTRTTSRDISSTAVTKRRQTDRRTDRQTTKQTGTYTHTYTQRKIAVRLWRDVDKQTDGQTDRQRNTQEHTQTHTYTER